MDDAKQPGPDLRNYLSVKRSCDLVMKGGVTSGVIYPAAVCELAHEYAFRSIGGTSAGAIAAALTAAAEYRRQIGKSDDGFRKLQRVPEDLGQIQTTGRSLLFSLFTPDEATRALFATAVAGLGSGTWTQRLLRILRAGLWNFRGWTLLGAALGALLGAVLGVLVSMVLGAAPSGVLGIMLTLQLGPVLGVGFHAVISTLLSAMFGVGLGVAGGLILLVAGAICGAGWGLVRTCLRAIPANFYGLCSGLATKRGDSPHLADWLVERIDDIAGTVGRGRPLTFGDLWGEEEDSDGNPVPRKIVLQFMTSNLTYGRPYQLPFEDSEKSLFYFDPAEFRRLFPEHIVDYMVDVSRPRNPVGRFVALPPARELPVVVAARMSLSFPILISAVPLYAIEYSKSEETPQPERCWFSDGGIASNFPVHLFDGPVPARPTFAINLRSEKERGSSGRKNGVDVDNDGVYMPRTNRAGMRETRVDIDGTAGGNIGAFLLAAFNCMQNWNDNAQLRLPGFRDRVAHVYLKDAEGGLNLDMGHEIIQTLERYGSRAAEEIAANFAPDRADDEETGTFSWNNHRWVRYRTTMALLETMLLRMLEVMDTAETPGDKDLPGGTYGALLARKFTDLPGYQWRSEAQWTFAKDRTDSLLHLAREWKEDIDKYGTSFQDGVPHPAPELKVRPRL